ncbi:DUF4167 domain-containing protein [Devosia sp.]|uniref:DUF4167 domain-containing protein n=1 Tax=Devosia sp. TaxID=1871048 RepID=UPI003A932041
MRPNQQNNKNRSRGRNNNGGRKHVNPLSRNYESNGPDVKVRGNAAHVAEKYMQLARDAQASGDSVMAENYLQHAEHYFRIVSAAQPQQRDQNGQVSAQEDEDDDFPPINDRFSMPERPSYNSQGNQPQQSGQDNSGNDRSGNDRGGNRGNNQSAESNDEAARAESKPEQAAAPAATAAKGDAGGDEQQQAEGEARPRRERRPRRRRVTAEAGAPSDPANAPQPEVGELPSFITAGNPAAE